MNAYTVHLADGSSYVIEMQAELEEAAAHFVGRRFQYAVLGPDSVIRHHANYVTRVEPAKPPCVNSDAQQETTHGKEQP